MVRMIFSVCRLARPRLYKRAQKEVMIEAKSCIRKLHKHLLSYAYSLPHGAEFINKERQETTDLYRISQRLIIPNNPTRFLEQKEGGSSAKRSTVTLAIAH